MNELKNQINKIKDLISNNTSIRPCYSWQGDFLKTKIKEI